ncbi:hypothetical protein BsWGS_18185 [Bradybaena similaris]
MTLPDYYFIVHDKYAKWNDSVVTRGQGSHGDIVVVLVEQGLRHIVHHVPAMNYAIRTTWNGDCVKHEPVKISLAPSHDGGMLIRVVSPFFNSPAKPNGPAGQPFPGLWDYEVVEAFFLNDNNQYLEVELCPHGQHLLLMLNGQRKMVKDQLPLTHFNATIDGDRWLGEAILPRSYFPPGVTRFNAYAIHGEGPNRIYESLFPATWKLDQPDFHRLEFFQGMDMTEMFSDYNKNEVSDLWRPYVAK